MSVSSGSDIDTDDDALYTPGWSEYYQDSVFSHDRTASTSSGGDDSPLLQRLLQMAEKIETLERRMSRQSSGNKDLFSQMAEKIELLEGRMDLVEESKKQGSETTANTSDDKSTSANSKEDKNLMKVPEDSYSFVHLCGPLKDPAGFLFGMAVFILQLVLLLTLVLTIVVPDLDTNGALADGSLSSIWPADVEPMVRLAQLVAAVTYALFADESMSDLLTGVMVIPTTMKHAQKGDRIGGLLLSSILRVIQGLAAAVATFFLVFTSTNARDVVLNFAAVNFVSRIDDAAFISAQRGYYLNSNLKQIAVEKIPSRGLPAHIVGKKYPWAQKLTVISTAAAMMVGAFSVINQQVSSQFLDTGYFRLVFPEVSSIFGQYNGCYRSGDTGFSFDRFLGSRLVYKRSSLSNSNSNEAKFGYCKEERRWNLFVADHDDACEVGESSLLAHSSETTDFEIRNTIGDTWFSAQGTPLDLQLITDGVGVSEEGCDAAIGDGRCDEILNIAAYGWDEGDCCAATCVGTECGIKAMQTAFDNVLMHPGNGYPSCKNPEMVSITIVLNEYIPKYSDAFSGFQFQGPPFLTFDCDGINHLMITLPRDGAFVNRAETVKVKDGAFCKLGVRTEISLSYVDYTLYTGVTDRKILSGIANGATIGFHQFQLLRECYAENLSFYTDADSLFSQKPTFQRKVLDLLQSSSLSEYSYSSCNNPYFIERYALAVVLLTAQGDSGSANNAVEIKLREYMEQSQCSWPVVICDGGNVIQIDISFEKTSKVFGVTFNGTLAKEIVLFPELKVLIGEGNELGGAIPSEIGQLTDMQEIYLEGNNFSGAVPTELGNLSLLKSLHIDRNNISGAIPSELGNLSMLGLLFLDQNKLEGAIPSELGNLSALQYMVINENNFDGTIPSELGKLSKLNALLLGNSFSAATTNLDNTIPSELGNLSQLERLWLYSNNLYGTIPAQLGNLSRLTMITLANNNLNGKIPLELGQLTALTFVTLQSNNLSGNGDSLFCNPGKVADFLVVDCSKVECSCCDGCPPLSPTTSPVPTEACPGKTENTSCSICDDGQCVRNPSAQLELSNVTSTCGDEERSGWAFRGQTCDFSRVHYLSVCGCHASGHPMMNVANIYERKGS